MIPWLFAATMLVPPVAGSPIEHVIVVIQENRTTDNLFASSALAGGGPFPGADVTQTAIVDGKKIPLRPTPFEDPADPDHTHASLVAEWNDGKMDGFANDRVWIYSKVGWPSPPANFPLAYVPDNETLLYHLLARKYALADENFSPRLTPTFPGHLFLIATQSQAADDPTDPIDWGCDSVPGTTVPIFTTGEREQRPGVFPCFDDPTIGDLLDRAHVGWKYYTGALGSFPDANLNVYDAIRHDRFSPVFHEHVSVPMSNVLGDIAACRLPQVAYVTPTWMNSDHAGELTNGGPAWVGSIYMAILDSRRNRDPACRYYDDTAMFVTWDDSGGWYDHVPPPRGLDGTRWGFRVPIVLISAWARAGYVSHVRRETTSIVRFIEKNWNLGTLSARDATDDDLSDMFDYARPKPIPPYTDLALQRAIEAGSPGWNLAQSLLDTRVVDDE